jgi:Skp family chaperone for outer membrane proteins
MKAWLMNKKRKLRLLAKPSMSMRLQLAAAAVLCLMMPVAGSVADKIGFFNPTDTIARFPPAASAQDIAQAHAQKVLTYTGDLHRKYSQGTDS